MDVSVNGVELWVVEDGPEDGPVVVLLHGFPELGYSWRHQIPALTGAGFRVVVPDLRGFGRSHAPPDLADYSIRPLAGILRMTSTAAHMPTPYTNVRYPFHLQASRRAEREYRP